MDGKILAEAVISRIIEGVITRAGDEILAEAVISQIIAAVIVWVSADRILVAVIISRIIEAVIAHAGGDILAAADIIEAVIARACDRIPMMANFTPITRMGGRIPAMVSS